METFCIFVAKILLTCSKLEKLNFYRLRRCRDSGFWLPHAPAPERMKKSIILRLTQRLLSSPCGFFQTRLCRFPSITAPARQGHALPPARLNSCFSCSTQLLLFHSCRSALRLYASPRAAAGCRTRAVVGHAPFAPCGPSRGSGRAWPGRRPSRRPSARGAGGLLRTEWNLHRYLHYIYIYIYIYIDR